MKKLKIPLFLNVGDTFVNTQENTVSIDSLNDKNLIILCPSGKYTYSYTQIYDNLKSGRYTNFKSNTENKRNKWVAFKDLYQDEIVKLCKHLDLSYNRKENDALCINVNNTSKLCGIGTYGSTVNISWLKKALTQLKNVPDKNEQFEEEYFKWRANLRKTTKNLSPDKRYNHLCYHITRLNTKFYDKLEGKLCGNKVDNLLDEWELDTKSKSDIFSPLTVGKEIILCAYKGQVKRSGSKYYINKEGSNTAFFRKIDTNRFSIQNRILGYRVSGDFPLCRSLSDLTKFCNAIEKEYIKQSYVDPCERAEKLSKEIDELFDDSYNGTPEFWSSKQRDYSKDPINKLLKTKRRKLLLS